MLRAHICILSVHLISSHFHFIAFDMPRSIILRPPGGASGISRVRYSSRDKLAIISKIRRIKQDTGLSYRKAAAQVGVCHTLVYPWSALRERFDNLDIKKLPRYSLAHGPCSQLEGVKEELLAWIFERREMGLVVSTRSIIIKACCILPLMEQKSSLVRLMVMRRFLKKQSLVYRMGTKVSQRLPAEVSQEATEFQEFIRPMLLGPERSLHWIINMDQTPVFFSMHPKKTLEILGTKTVVIRTSTNDTKRATVALTITAAGDQLVPMVVYKGTENGTIKKRELQNHHPTCIYKTQHNAWMDERVMLRWVEDVLAPYVALAPPGIIPLILLDSYRCHVMASVVNVIQDLGCEVVHIPGGCTGLVQPLDVGYNKPFKARIRKAWEEYMINDMRKNGSIETPSREEVSHWIAEAYWDMEGTPIIKNSWLKTGYSWF